MSLLTALQPLAVAAALGLLVGLQRERSDSAIAGIRTFPLITVLGTLAAMLGDPLGGWVVAAGFLALAATVVVGNVYAARSTAESPGITTEVAILVMYALGAYLWRGDVAVATAVGVGVAVLLHAKPFLHGLASRMGEGDLKSILQFAVITFVILPLLPDRTVDPLGAINPHKVWLLVVLMVGISLAGYVAYKAFGPHQGTVLAGVLGGLVSSTATTASYARLAALSPGATASSLVVFMLATTVVFARVAVEVAVVAPRSFGAISPPIFAMMLVAAVVSTVVFLLTRTADPTIPERENPAQLKAAIVLAGVFILVLLATAAAGRYLGQSGLYAVAAVSGLSDMDSITISLSRMAEAGEVSARTAWRGILIASIANLAFKAGIVWMLAGRRVFFHTVRMFACVAASGVLLIVFW